MQSLTFTNTTAALLAFHHAETVRNAPYAQQSMSIAEGVFSTGKLTHCRQVENNQQVTLCVTEVIHLSLQPLAKTTEVGSAWGIFGKQRKRIKKGGMNVHFWIYRYV